MSGMSRRKFVQITGAGALAAAMPSLGRSQNAPADKRPNIIYILADDLGYGDLGCYGQKRIKTPNLDRMAAQGMRFTQHYAGSTVCAPSRCCLMTGYHTGDAYIRGNGAPPLRPNDYTVAEMLKKEGYRTGLIGKWGLGEEESTGNPNAQGFDYYFGYLNQLHAHNYYPEFLWRNGEKVELDNEVKRVKDRRYGAAATKRVEYSHDLFAADALRFVEENQSHPFFLYLAYTIPHANNEAVRLLDHDGMEVPDYGEYKDMDWPDAQKGHAAMITRMDQDIGDLIKKLQDLGLDENTLVMFSSDNGPHREGRADPEFFNSNGPFRGIKRDLYEGGIRVPMIARWPGKIAEGTETDHISAFWDVMPTLADVVGTEAPLGIDGISFLPTLLGDNEDQIEHLRLYWEFYEQNGKQAVRDGKWKAVRTNLKKDRNAPFELYDLSIDPGEENNIADRHPDIIEKMKKHAAIAHTKSEHWSW